MIKTLERRLVKCAKWSYKPSNQKAEAGIHMDAGLCLILSNNDF